MAAIDYYDQVQEIYIAYYGRPADTAGLDYWATQLNTAGGNLSVIIDAFGTSAEATTLFSGMSSAAKINALYQQCFGRDADFAGLNWYVAQLNAGTMTQATIMLNILDGATGTDATAVANKLAVATAFTAAIDTSAEVIGYDGDAAALEARNYLATVTDTTASKDAALASVDTSLATVVAAGTSTSGTPFSLTPGADIINGTSGDDTITGSIGTLSTVDEIHGGLGTDTMTVIFAPELATAGANSAAAPIVSGVEILNITSRNNSAQLDFTDIKGVTALNVGGNNSLDLLNMETLTAVSVNAMSATLTIDQAAATASTAAFGLTLNMSASTAANLVWADDAGASTALLDTLTINALSDVTLSTGSTFSGVEKLVLNGPGNVTLNVVTGAATGGMDITAISDLTANNTAAGIDASGLTGNLSLTLDAVMDINIKGGVGNDTFTMTANLNTNDTLNGGAGTADTLNAIFTGGYIRPVVSNIEVLNVLGNATAATADLRDVSGATTLNLMLATGMVIDKAQTSMSTINVNSSDGLTAQNALTLQYGTAAVASNVTLNLSNGVQSDFQTAAATAAAMALGTFTMSGNSGSLTIKANSTASWSVEAIALSDVTAVTIDAASGSLALSAVGMGTAADTITLQAAAGKSIVACGAMSAMGADTLSFNVNGASALIDLSAVNVGTANSITITTNSAMTGAVAFSATDFVFQSAAAATGAVDLNTFTINALGGDVLIGTASFLSGTTSVSTLFEVNMGGTAVNVTIANFSAVDMAQAATASEQSLTFDINGTGNFTLSNVVLPSSNINISIDSRDLASGNGSNLTVSLAGVDDLNATVSAIFGAHSGTYLGADGVDNIEFGAGSMIANGGLGADIYTLSTAANTMEISVNTIAGVDTLLNAGTGDTILFSAANTATANTYLNSAWLTGTNTNTSQILTGGLSAVATAAGLTALKQLAIYTAAGDTIIEMMGGSASLSAGTGVVSATDDFVRVVLNNKDFTAITASFQINTNGSGLSITLL